MMKLLTALAISAIVVFTLASAAKAAAALETFGKVEFSGGVEREPHVSAGGRGTVEALGVLPLMGNFGLQGSVHYVGGLGSRAGLSVGPLFAWDSGKVGGFVAYQHRGLRDSNFVHLVPSMAFYLDQMNFSLWYAHPVTGAQRGGHRVEYGVNKIQGTASYYPGSDWASFLRKDNVEFMLGVQANTFAGAGHQQLGGTGVGPVFGISFLPMRGVTVNLVRGTFDNKGRYKVASGLELFYDAKGSTTLKDARRKYLEPNTDMPAAGGKVKVSRSRPSSVD
jgi:hypothetical protein